MRTVLRNLPFVPRAVALGASGVGVVGAVTGLIIGLRTYPSTAPFAVIELGAPAAVVGALAGLVVGSIAVAVRHKPRRHGP